MEYSDGLKRRILESRHQFIYGDKKERSDYLKRVSSQVYLENEKKTIPIYTDFTGFSDTDNKECEIWRLNSIHNDYFELYVTNLMFDRLRNELQADELQVLENNLEELFHCESLNNFDTLKWELEIGMMAYKEFYEHYIKTGELKSDLTDEVKLSFVMFDMFLPELKQVVPSFQEFILFIDKQTQFSSIYTSVINTYIASRSNGYLSMKIGCENKRDWDNYSTVNGEYVEYVHDYGVVLMDEYKLVRTKEEQ